MGQSRVIAAAPRFASLQTHGTPLHTRLTTKNPPLLLRELLFNPTGPCATTRVHPSNNDHLRPSRAAWYKRVSAGGLS